MSLFNKIENSIIQYIAEQYKNLNKLIKNKKVVNWETKTNKEKTH